MVPQRRSTTRGPSRTCPTTASFDAKQKKRFARYDPVRFTGIQARAIARGFAIAAAEANYLIYALAILRDHAHVVLGRHERHVDQIAAHMKAKATMRLNAESLHPFAHQPRADGTLPSPWARNYWCPFIDTQEYLSAAIKYVNENPSRSGLKRQTWQCVVKPKIG